MATASSPRSRWPYVAFSAVILLSASAEAANVLAIEVVAGKSHWNFMSAVLRALTDRGHRVTVFTSFVDGDRENYTEVDVSGAFPRALDADVWHVIDRFGDAVATMTTGLAMARDYCDAMHRDTRLLAILRDGPRAGFDAILVEPMWLDCTSYMAATLHVPLVHVLPYPTIAFLERRHFGHAPNPASVSHLLARHAVPGTFVQRLTNAMTYAYSALVIGYNRLLLEYAAHPKPYYYLSAGVRPSAVFVNTHRVTEAPRPVPPNVVHVGGIHLNAPRNIPNDILEFINDSPHGVIIFTFGSSVNMSTLPNHIQNAFKDAISEVPQRVLWKYGQRMENKPNNVMTKTWFPQRDILLHPNVKLFISHGGISGIYEAVDAGVPVLGFPLYFDQPRNIENLVDAGMAISMDLFGPINKEIILKNILELVENKKYSVNAKIASKRFKDRPMTPAQSVVYWTEYVIRHGGAQHLKSDAINLYWYQYCLLDIVAAASIFFIIVSYVLFKVTQLSVLYSLSCIQTR